MGERRGAFRVSVGKPEVKRPMRKTRHKWENKITYDGSSGSGLWGHGLD